MTVKAMLKKWNKQGKGIAFVFLFLTVTAVTIWIALQNQMDMMVEWDAGCLPLVGAEPISKLVSEFRLDKEREQRIQALSLIRDSVISDPDMEYWRAQPCHFLVYIDYWRAIEVAEIYRNISTDNLLRDDGSFDLYDSDMAYMADKVVDAYIREYGGEDCLYTVEWLPDRLPEDCDGTVYLITGDNVRLEVTDSRDNGNVVSVIIENQDGAKPKPQEYTEYITYKKYYNEEELQPDDGWKTYWMVIDPARAGNAQKFRNVSPQEMLEEGEERADIIGYYIADEAIDRYIRDYGGSDTFYKVHLTEKTLIGNGLYAYRIQAECGSAKLLIDYSEDTWLVHVEAQDAELELLPRVCTYEDIKRAIQREDLKAFSFGTRTNLPLSGITNLTNLEKLHIMLDLDIKNMDLFPIGELTQLKDFYIWESNLDMSFLEKLENLEKLEIGRSKVPDLSFVQNMTQLKRITVSDIEDTDLAYFKNEKNLESVWLEGYRIRNLEGLSGTEHLQRLSLTEKEKDAAKRGTVSLEVLSEMEELQSLTLVRIKAEDITPISGLSNLEELILVDIGLEDIQCLASLTNLKTLEINGEENSEELKQQAEQYLPWLESVWIIDYVMDTYE